MAGTESQLLWEQLHDFARKYAREDINLARVLLHITKEVKALEETPQASLAVFLRAKEELLDALDTLPEIDYAEVLEKTMADNKALSEELAALKVSFGKASAEGEQASATPTTLTDDRGESELLPQQLLEACRAERDDALAKLASTQAELDDVLGSLAAALADKAEAEAVASRERTLAKRYKNELDAMKQLAEEAAKRKAEAKKRKAEAVK